MWITILVSSGILILFLCFWIFSKKETTQEDKPDVVYVCSECGEKHCNCYKEEKPS